MRKLALILLATSALVVGGSAYAMPIGSVKPASDAVSPIEKSAVYIVEGNRYCFYFDGWHGPGWYRCGFAFRRGLGWGGSYGWHGWRYGPADRRFGGSVTIREGRRDHREGVRGEFREGRDHREGIRGNVRGNTSIREGVRGETRGSSSIREGSTVRGGSNVRGETTGRGGASGSVSGSGNVSGGGASGGGSAKGGATVSPGSSGGGSGGGSMRKEGGGQ
jgi:hypothetical protein